MGQIKKEDNERVGTGLSDEKAAILIKNMTGSLNRQLLSENV
jgi:hypothetical protein